jgi:hypothetical protein
VRRRIQVWRRIRVRRRFHVRRRRIHVRIRRNSQKSVPRNISYIKSL